MDIEELGNKKKIINNYEDPIKWEIIKDFI